MLSCLKYHKWVLSWRQKDKGIKCWTKKINIQRQTMLGPCFVDWRQRWNMTPPEQPEKNLGTNKWCEKADGWIHSAFMSLKSCRTQSGRLVQLDNSAEPVLSWTERSKGGKRKSSTLDERHLEQWHDSFSRSSVNDCYQGWILSAVELVRSCSWLWHSDCQFSSHSLTRQILLFSRADRPRS